MYTKINVQNMKNNIIKYILILYKEIETNKINNNKNNFTPNLKKLKCIEELFTAVLM